MEQFYEAGATITHTQLKQEWMAVKSPDELMDLCERVNQLGCDGSITEGEMKRLMDQLMTAHNSFKEEGDEEVAGHMTGYMDWLTQRAEQVRGEICKYIFDIIETLPRHELLDAYHATEMIDRDVWMAHYGHKVECPTHMWQDLDFTQEIIEEIYNDVLWNTFEVAGDEMRRDEHYDDVSCVRFELKKSERQAWVDEPGMLHRSMSDFEYVDECFEEYREEDFDEAYEVYVEDRQEWMDEPSRPWREDFDWEWVDRVWEIRGPGPGFPSPVMCRAVDKLWNEAIMQATLGT
mgnify:FL=1